MKSRRSLRLSKIKQSPDTPDVFYSDEENSTIKEKEDKKEEVSDG